MNGFRVYLLFGLGMIFLRSRTIVKICLFLILIKRIPILITFGRIYVVVNVAYCIWIVILSCFNSNGKFEIKDIDVLCSLCHTDKITEATRSEYIDRRRKLVKPNRMKNAFRGLSVSEKVLIRLKRPHILNLIKGNS